MVGGEHQVRVEGTGLGRTGRLAGQHPQVVGRVAERRVRARAALEPVPTGGAGRPRWWASPPPGRAASSRRSAAPMSIIGRSPSAPPASGQTGGELSHRGGPRGGDRGKGGQHRRRQGPAGARWSPRKAPPLGRVREPTDQEEVPDVLEAAGSRPARRPSTGGSGRSPRRPGRRRWWCRPRRGPSGPEAAMAGASGGSASAPDDPDGARGAQVDVMVMPRPCAACDRKSILTIDQC